MSTQTSPRFPHRHNPDGSYDAICTRCFATVATARREDELAALEKAHVCDESKLMQLSKIPPKTD